MSDAVGEPPRPACRFFCHRCNVEFEDNLQEFTCPYCSTGFIERLEGDRDSSGSATDGEYTDDVSNVGDASMIDDSLESSSDDTDHQNLGEFSDVSNVGTSMVDDSLHSSSDDTAEENRQGQPVLNDLAFLMSGGMLRPVGRRSESLMEQLVLMIGGRGAPGAVTAGTPFVLVGAPGDYVFGGEGLDAVVTQLLGQLENTGPPPLPGEQINAIPSEKITAAQVEANMSCSVCWDNFTLDESVSRLECEHIFHAGCIRPWLQLHATCPVCRRAVGAAPPAAPQPAATAPAGLSRVVVRRYRGRRREADGAGGLWAQLASSLASSPADAASPSASRADYMDIDYD